jgi:hypothetical protein
MADTQTSGATSPAPDPAQTDEAPVREAAPNPKFDPPKGNPGSGRFAVYDTTLGRYVGNVVDSKSDASKSDAAKGAASFKVVEV